MDLPRVLNGASYAAADLGPGIAPGSIFIIPGQGLGPGELIVASQPYPKRLPDEPGGTEVEFRSMETGDVFRAALIHSVLFQVSGIVPAEMPLGLYSATVRFQGQSASTKQFLVVRSAPGLFALSMNGTGPGVIQNFEPAGSTALNQLTRPALPGDHLIIWGTGLGDARISDGIGSRALPMEDDVWVEFENLRVRPSYAGPAPGFPGLDQINVQLPAQGLPELGCYVPLRVTAGAASNTVTVSLSETAGACRHPLRFSADTLRRLDAGGAVSIGEVYLSRQNAFDANLIPGAENVGWGYASASFYQADAQRVAFTGGLERRRRQLGCRPETATAGAVFWFDTDAFPQGLDAGEVLTATGPAGQMLLLERAETQVFTGNYLGPDSLPGSTLQTGPWRISGTGGPAVGPFEVDLPVLPRFLFAYPRVVQRDAPVTVSWPAAGLQDSQIVTIDFSVNISEPDGEFNETSRSEGISCQAPAQAGRLTIPVELLQNLPSEHDGTGSIHFGIQSVPTVFQAEGLDYGVARMSVSETRSVKVE